MKFFRRQNQDPSQESLADAYNTPEQSKVDWKRAIPRLVALALVVALVAGGVLWVFGAFDNDAPKPPKKEKTIQEAAHSDDSRSNSTASGKTGPSRSDSMQTQSTGTTGSTGSRSTGGTSTPTSGKSTQTTDQLADSGPGEVLAVFAVTTAAGATIYQVALRRQNSTS